MSDLAEFLLARIAEDEAVADRAAAGVAGRSISANNREDAAHVARWTPDRVLAECEAQRRIVGLHPCGYCGSDGDPCETLRLLALPYADHPDYRDQWRP